MMSTNAEHPFHKNSEQSLKVSFTDTQQIEKSTVTNAPKIIKCADNKCPYTCRNNHLLRVHMLIHTRNAPYKCGLCTASLTTPGNLACHKYLHVEYRTIRAQYKTKFRTEAGTSTTRHVSNLSPVTALRQDINVNNSETEKSADFDIQHDNKNTASFGEASGTVGQKSAYHRFDCDCCGISFKTRLQLSCHRGRKHGFRGRTKYWRMKSPKNFRRKTQQNNHRVDHLNEDSTAVSAQSTKTFRYHQNLKCTHCNEEFKRIDAFQEHMFIAHDIAHPYQCSECPKTFRQIYSIKSHQNVHKRNGKFRCNYCSATYNCKGSLKAHIPLHLREDRTKRLISVSQANFISNSDNVGLKQRNLTNARVSFSSTGNKPQTVTDANRRNPSTSHLKDINTVNQMEKFENRLSDTSHNMTKSDKTLPNGLSTKLKKSHEVDSSSRGTILIGGGCKKKPDLTKPYTCCCCIRRHKCHRCFMGFTTKYVLYHHINFVHREELSFLFKCTDCPARYKTAKSLLQHQAVHGRNEKFKCDFCTASYPHDIPLNRHIISDHFGQNPPTSQFSNSSTNFNESIDLTSSFLVPPPPPLNMCRTGDDGISKVEGGKDSNEYECHCCHSRFKTVSAYLLHKDIRTCMRKALMQPSSDGDQRGVHGMINREAKQQEMDFDNVSATPIKNEYFKCSECPGQFRTESLLENHSTAHRSKPFKYKCGKCTASFQSKLDKARHRILHATGRQYAVYGSRGQFACAQCPAYYSEEKRLMTHITCHRQDNEFHCDLCTASFVKYSLLVDHKRFHKNWAEIHGIVFEDLSYNPTNNYAPCSSKLRRSKTQMSRVTNENAERKTCSYHSVSVYAPNVAIEVKQEPDSSDYENIVTTQTVTMSAEVVKAPE